MIKRILDLFRTEGQETKGWLGIKGKFIAHDKQKHIVLGILIYALGMVYFWLYKDGVIENASETSFLIVFLISFAWEIQNMFGLIGKKSMFNFTDIMATCFIPFLIHMPVLYL